jgi:6,7-dimethyl-8-ribityllumazine synthase
MNQSTITHSSTAAVTRIAFIQSSWHKDIVDQGRDSFVKHMAELGVARSQIDVVEVPGAYEIPLHAKLLARSRRYHGIVACGFVVDGGIYRHEFVASAVINGLMQVQLETEVPVFSVVLTPQHFHEHADHRDFFLKHFVAKGAEAAQACQRTLQSLEQLRKTFKSAAVGA